MEGCTYNCKSGLCNIHGLTRDEEAAIVEKAKQDAQLKIDDLIAEAQRKRAEDDQTNINVVPIILNDDPKLEIEGMFFNENQIAKEDEPAIFLEIEKDVLDRSSGFIIGRFKFEIQNRAKIVFEVFVDGVKVDDYGTNLPYMEKSGVYDTTLFRWPNSKKANKDGMHSVQVKAGLITGIVEKELGMIAWGKVKAVTSEVFRVNLLKHQIVD